MVRTSTDTRWVRLRRQRYEGDSEIPTSDERQKIDAGSMIGRMFVGPGRAEKVTIDKDDGTKIVWSWDGETNG